jgi:glycosyltransferase involved in cell wall biosynthesis
MDCPLVSIIMPAYNAEKYIGDSIESVIIQTYQNWELIIIDDGSKDSTLKIAKQYESRQIKVHARINMGQSAQLNFGISLAKGAYIAIAHADDINLPARMEKQVAFLQINPTTAICGTFAYFFDEKEILVHKQYPTNSDNCFLALFDSNPLVHPAVMMRKSAIQNLPYIYAEELNAAEDYDLWVRMSTSFKIDNVAEPLLKYRLHAAQLSNTRRIEEDLIVKRTRISFVRQLTANLKRSQYILVYHTLYRSKKMSMCSFWKATRLLNKILKPFIENGVNLQLFMVKIINSYLKKVPYYQRLAYLPFCLYLFCQLDYEHARNIFIKSFLIRSEIENSNI